MPELQIVADCDTASGCGGINVLPVCLAGVGLGCNLGDWSGTKGEQLLGMSVMAKFRPKH
jgi:hypothetical protein